MDTIFQNAIKQVVDLLIEQKGLFAKGVTKEKVMAILNGEEKRKASKAKVSSAGLNHSQVISSMHDMSDLMKGVPDDAEIVVKYMGCRFDDKTGSLFKKETGAPVDGEKLANIEIEIRGIKTIKTQTTLAPAIFKSEFYQHYPNYIVFSYGIVTKNGIVGMLYNRGAMYVLKI